MWDFAPGFVTWHNINFTCGTLIFTGAAQPEYTITADDCDSMVAIECVPMDERGRRVRGYHDKAGYNLMIVLLNKVLKFTCNQSPTLANCRVKLMSWLLIFSIANVSYQFLADSLFWTPVFHRVTWWLSWPTMAIGSVEVNIEIYSVVFHLVREPGCLWLTGVTFCQEMITND